jgi:hypothetical protein
MKYQRLIAGVLSTASICYGTSFAQTPGRRETLSCHDTVGCAAVSRSLGYHTQYARWKAAIVDRSLSGEGNVKATFVSRWGSARPLSVVSVSDGKLIFVSSKEEEARKTDMEFHGRLAGGKLVGSTTGPNGDVWTWVGVRAPAVLKAGTPKWGVPIRLFNGRDMDGWHEFPANYFPQPGHWKVENGTLISQGHGPELVTDGKFQDFKLHLQFDCGPTSNSGVYLRGRYELQIENESADEPPSHHTAGIYGFLTANPEPAKTTGQWRLTTSP